MPGRRGERHEDRQLSRPGGGGKTSNLVTEDWQPLRRPTDEFNVLCTVKAANQSHGPTIYR